MDFFDLWKLGSPLDVVEKWLLRRNFSAMLRRNADSDDSSFHNEMCYNINFASDYVVTLVMTILSLTMLRRNLCEGLKAQLQDKNIAISELKKLIKKMKGKTMDTKFDKLSVVQQPNALQILKPSVLGKPTPFSNSLERKVFDEV
nr:hypothetical protein [Tanacetum cinerariifolium]